MGKYDAGVKIPVLDKDNYFHWKVKMRLHLNAIDEAYVDCIEKGPHIPMKAATGVGEEGMIPKPLKEQTLEDIEAVHKDKKAMNILFNGIDQDMFDCVLNLSTSKEVWDTIQTICEGTEQVRENKMQLLIQQYEYFHYKSGEKLTDIYSRFQKLLNGLKLYGRVYEVKDSNLKFLRSLPKEWKPMTVSLRNSQEYKSFTLDRLYGVLKTYELEMEQDEELEKGQKKGTSVALVASNSEMHNDRALEELRTTPRAEKCGCSMEASSKGKSKAIKDEETSTEDELEELDEHMAFLAKRFSKLKFKRSQANSRPYNKSYQSSKNWTDKSKINCFNCGIAGHLSTECRKPKSEKKERQNEPVDYKKKYFDLLRQKEKAFISKGKDWADDSDSEEDTEHVNLALMAIEDQEVSSSSNQVISANITELSKEECNNTINEMSTELYHLHVSLKSLTKENVRIRAANDLLTERNALLEAQFVEFEKLRKDCRIAKDELLFVLKREESVKKELEKEQELIARWGKSREVVSEIIKVQGIKSFHKDSESNKNKEEEIQKLDCETCSDSESTDSDHPLTVEPSTDESYPLTEGKSVSKSKLKNLDGKYGSLSKNFVLGESSKINKVESGNIGHLSKKKLVEKLEAVKSKNEEKKKKNRNGKIGINKKNNYTPDKYAPRKTCIKCGSVNHISVNCSIMKNSSVHMPLPTMPVNVMPAMNNMFVQNAHAHTQFASMPYVPNPYFNAFSMPNLSWNMPGHNNMFAPPFQYPIIDNCANEQLTNKGSQKPTPKVKVDSKPPKPEVQKGGKSKKNPNKAGPKETWVPKST